MKKQIHKWMACILSISMALALLLPGNAALAAGSFPLLNTSYLSATSTTSKTTEGEKIESYDISTTTSNSLWFTNESTKTIVRTHNDNTYLHLTGGKVEIVVRENGSGLSYRLIDGDDTSATIDQLESVTTEKVQYTIRKYTIDYEKHIVDKDAPYSIFTAGTVILANPGTSIPYTRYETNVYIYWDRRDLAAAPNVSFVQDVATGNMVLSGVNSTMEYRLKSASATWQPCTDTPMYFDATGTANKTYYVRYAANETQKESQVKEVVLPGKRPAPEVTYDTTSEIISGLSTSMEIRFGNGSYAPLSATTLKISDIVDAIPANEPLTVTVRHAATATDQAGLDKKFTVYPRLSAPTSIEFNPITTTLTGYPTSMQYQTDTDTGWRTTSGTSLSLLNFASETRDVVVFVRVKPTSTNAASRSIEITIPKLLPGPTGTLDFYNEVISGLPNGNYQYRISGTSWTNLTITNGTWNISPRITSSETTLYLRMTATATRPVTAATPFTLPARLAAPTTPDFKYNDAQNQGKAVLTGLTNEMEYRISTAATWNTATGTDIPMDIPARGLRYQVRYRATPNSFCSENKSFILSQAANPPSISYNTTTELVTGLNDTMEIKIGTGSYASVETGVTTYDVTSLVNQIPAGSTVLFTARTKATATKPASLEKVFTLYPRLTKPATVVFNRVPLTLTGYTTAMQYRLDTDAATSWRSMSGTSLNLETFASAERAVSIYVRMKPTTTASASQPVQFVIPQLLTGPTGTVDYINETITGLANGNYQYSTNGTAWTTVSATNGSCNISSVISTSAQTIYLRNAATSVAPITAYTSFAIPRRSAGPTTPKFVYDDINNPEKIVFRGLTTTMEYRKSTDTTWIPVSASEMVFDPQDTSVVYYVRTIATNSAWASAYKTVTMVARPAAPSITYTKSTETLSKLGIVHEISFNGGTYIPVTSSTYNLSEHIDNIPGGGTLVVRVRKKATASTPAGQETTITIEARVPQKSLPSDAPLEVLQPPVLTPEVLPAPEPDSEDLPEVDTAPDIEDVLAPEIEDSTTPSAQKE